MPFGTLTPAMQAIIREHALGRTVWDLGAGDLTYAKRLIQLGARKVVAVEKGGSRPGHLGGIATPLEAPLRPDPRIECVWRYFAEVDPPEDGIEVAFLSWPQNGALATIGLTRLIEGAQTVIYLGCNTGGSACGSGDMWRHLIQREVLAYEPMVRNTLIVYGQPCGPRTLRGEEMGALASKMVRFEDVEEWSLEMRQLFHES